MATPKSNSKCRQLKAGDPIPSVEPKRYINPQGYVLLRWRVGPREYVEAKEHRFVMGFPEGADVHHINGVKTDNRPDNLQALTPKEHGTEHHVPTWDVFAAAAEYKGGMGYRTLGRKYGVHQVTVMRMLKGLGVASRKRNGGETHCINGHAFSAENTYRWKSSRRSCRACIRNRAKAKYRRDNPGSKHYRDKEYPL